MSFTWPQLIEVLDRPERNGADTSTLKLVVSILLACPSEATPHAVEAFWTKWNNPLHQIKLLEALVSLPSDTFNFVRVPGRRVVTVDDVTGASPTIKALAANVQGQTWNSLPLFEILMKLADLGSGDVQAVVRDMLEKAVRISSELVHMGLLQVPVRVFFFYRHLANCVAFRNHGMIFRSSLLLRCLPCFWPVIPIINWSSCVSGKSTRAI
jgi:CCR4-NOT transcription complex subunit 1